MTTNEHEQEHADEQQSGDEAAAPAAGMSNEEAMEVEEELTDGSGYPG